MPNQEDLIRVVAYTPLDDKVFIYNFVTEQELQETVEAFMNDIWFYLTDEEINEYLKPEKPVDNLKEDFIYYTAKINAVSYWSCTCGNFLETDQKGEDRMIKRTVAHARKTGHTINPRGN